MFSFLSRGLDPVATLMSALCKNHAIVNQTPVPRITKGGGVEKQLIREFYIVLSLDKVEECIDHPKQNDRESHHQEHAAEVVPPDLGLDADVGH